MTLYTLITGFNLYKPEYGYRDLVFSLRFFMNILNEVNYLPIDMRKLSASYPQECKYLQH